ncbi:monofunctional biosynthetic peptidoglycan transglycosylase [Chryseolinea lacunae]|uniref:Biosynthetic peptidoglycan transglycosylase n=1 Tax=Chryseolinea lacunae TaxID=2801331 RepID=A0ABS1KYG3_9BACT|nr:monofunctional biosynthetic peptidoglycan transglycosylase [Chryseolinea lacunae]MBL0744490.1 monofunctional biosynthetic peptidoglycan transglycosylase [Chryseolinea lacunae]
MKAWLISVGLKIKNIFLFLFAAQLIYIIVLKWVDPPITVTQLQSWVHRDGLRRDYVNLDDMSPHAALAVIASEDQLFPDHNGFDIKSIKKAMELNKKKPNRLRGASTISQQVAKNVFLWQGRSWLRKGLEVYFTFMIEAVWGKRRILEMYLNVAEMGKGVFGIEAASRKFFNKSAKKLTRNEAAMIAASLPNPKKYTVKPVSKYINKRYPWVIQQMNFLHTDEDIRRLLPGAKKMGS